ncbi:type IX secretion system membrane protein PorP/SprF [Marinilabiliaceae bacterium JC017]|nr:type IX secretion system membrane protein PorP/SprF [Marinilabiliaceae bacterium JC017]
MRRIILLLSLVLSISGISAQKYYLTNQYVYDLFMMNPAAAGFYKDCYTVNGFYQKQWFGVDLAPTTQILSFQGPLSGGAGMGTYVYNDQNGNYKEMGLQQSFSYEVVLVKKRRTNSTLTFGLSLAAEQSSLDQTNFTETGMLDPAIGGGVESGWGINANTGVLLKYNKHHVGLAVTNLMPQTNSMYREDNEPDQTMDIHFHAGTTIKIPNMDIFLDPLLMYRRNMLVDSRLDLNLKAYFMTPDPDLTYWGLIAYRRTMDHAFGKSLGFAATFGVEFKSFNVGLEYQLGLTQAQVDYGSAYQVVFGYRFCRDKKKVRRVPCKEVTRHERFTYKRKGKK